MLWWMLAAANADVPDVSEGKVAAPHCVDGQCVGWWEGPSMGGCMGACCNMHELWVGKKGAKGDFVQLSHDDRPAVIHPLQVRWLVPGRRFEVLSGVPLLPDDDPTLDGWDLAHFRGTGVWRDVYEVDGVKGHRVESAWAFAYDGKARDALAAWLPPLADSMTKPVPDAGDDEVRRRRDAACKQPHDTVWAADCTPDSCLYVLGGMDQKQPKVTCVATVQREGGDVDVLAQGDFGLRRSENNLCLTGITDGVRGSTGGLLCIDPHGRGALAGIDMTGWTVSDASRYPLRYQDQEPKALERALSVAPSTRDRILHGEAHWSGPDDLSLTWKAVRVDDDLLLEAVIRDDHDTPGQGPGSDHLEIDVWLQPGGADRLPDVRLAVLRDGTAGTVRRWRWANQEVDEASPGTATWRQVPGGHQVTVRLPEAAAFREAGDRMLSIRASDGDDGHQTVIGTTAHVIWDNTPSTYVDAGGR